MSSADSQVVGVMLPTYNEAGNIRSLIQDIATLVPSIHIVVVDDNSPDGTWKIVEELRNQNPHIHLIHRKTQRGRGTAGIRGIQHCLDIGVDLIIEMDADYSHNPKYIHELITASRNADVVIGSRLISGGGETGRSPVRRWITVLANMYIRVLLGFKVRDCTSGYRIYSRSILQKIDLDSIQSTGPAVLQDLMIALQKAGARFLEIPIIFEERRAGQSSFNLRIMLQGIAAPLKLLSKRFKKYNQ